MSKLRSCCNVAVVAFCAVASMAAAPLTSPLDAVSGGSIVIYNVADLTLGRQDAADQLAKIIRDSVNPNLWRGTWRAAAVVATAEQLSVKADKDVQESVSRLLQQMHDTHNLFIRLDYKIVTAGDVPAAAKAVLNDPDKDNGFRVASTIVADSHMTVANGDDAILIDGRAVPLPTITVTPTLSADRSVVTIRVHATDVPAAATNPETIVSFDLNHSVGLRFQLNNGPAWLILRPQCVERDWLPVGSATLASRE